MERTLEQLFERFRSRSDLAALGEVFDRTASDLLRIAVHLAGPATAGEDLVQSTFMVAIEHAEDWDGSRPLRPWLTGILNNQARHARRRSARQIEPARLRSRLEQSPLEAAQANELSGELAEAIDRLPEPYRVVVNLRLRHGLPPAEIAHSLGRNPGTVRVQLHRGLEMLRKALPTGALAALVAFVPETSLAAVRMVVLSHAASVTVPLTVTSLLGALLMSPKVLIGGLSAFALLTLVLVGSGLWPGSASDTRETATAVTELEPLGDSASSKPELSVEEPSTDKLPSRADAPSQAPPEPEDGVLLKGRVVSADSGAPLPGAEVRIDPPVFLSHREQAMRWPHFAVMRLLPQPPIRHPLTDHQRLGLHPTPMFLSPDLSSTPWSRTMTRDDGSFEIRCPKDGGVISAQMDGYRARSLAVTDLSQSLELELERSAGGLLEGCVVDSAGEPIGIPIPLVFLEPSDRTVNPLKSMWRVDTSTRADGRFSVRLDADEVRVISMSPDWTLVKSETSDPTLLLPGDDSEVMLQAENCRDRQVILRVFDAETEAPIETFSLFGRNLGSGMPSFQGRYFAPRGEKVLFEDWYPSNLHEVDGHLELFISAPHYRAYRLEVEEIFRPGTYEAPLIPSDEAPVRGRVTRGGQPASGAEISLLPYWPTSWQPRGLHPITGATSDEEGRFELWAPDGELVLHVSHLKEDQYRTIELPGTGFLEIELEDIASIRVRVRDSTGVPRTDAQVGLSSEDGRNEYLPTDESGEVLFEDLAPGDYRIESLYPLGKSFFPHQRLAVELGPGEERFVELSIPGDAGAPVHARVVHEGTEQFDGWRARNPWSGSQWEPLMVDGTIPIDVRSGVPRMEIDSAAGQRWIVRIPSNPGPDHVVRLGGTGLGYRGVVRDRNTGLPIAGLRVAVDFDSADLHRMGTVTDEQGRFELIGLRSDVTLLLFGDTAGTETVSQDEYIRFEPAGPPSDPPRELTLSLPMIDTSDHGRIHGLENRQVRGQVTSTSGGGPVSGAKVSIDAVFPEADGRFFARLRKSQVSTNQDGQFEATLPRAPEYRALVFRMGPDNVPVTDAWTASGGNGDEIRDFVIED